MMEFADRARLLDPAPMPLELGWEGIVRPTGHLLIGPDAPQIPSKAALALSLLQLIT